MVNVRLNSRDPSGTRSDEDRQAREMRRLLTDAVSRASARIVQAGTSSPVEIDSILSEETDRMGQQMMESEIKSMDRSLQKATKQSEKILKKMGYTLGPEGIRPETTKALLVTTQKDVNSLAEDVRKNAARVLIDGMDKGLGAKAIAELLADATGGTLARSETIARTVIMKTYVDTAMDLYDDAGATGYEIFPTDDDRVCIECLKAAMEGGHPRVYKERPTVPVHPNCRCVVLPVFEGEATDYQKSIFRRIITFSRGCT